MVSVEQDALLQQPRDGRAERARGAGVEVMRAQVIEAQIIDTDGR